MKKLSWKKVGCLLLAMLMMATMLATGVVAWNNANDTEKGAIIIHKYEQKDNGQLNWPAGDPGNGTDNVQIPDGSTPLNGAEFTIYLLNDSEVSDKELKEAESVEAFLAEYGKKDESGEQIALTTVTATDNTLGDGIAKFEDLALGRYLVIETKAASNTTRTTPNFFVDVPMTNPDGDGWLYTVHVYPKNALVRGDVTLEKISEDSTPLANAVFGLYAAEDGTKLDEVASTEEGKIVIDNLPVGDYYLQEITAPNGYTLSTTKYSFSITADKWSYHFTTDKNQKAINFKQITEDDFTKENAGTIGARDINWELTATIPGDIKLYKTFKVSDTLPTELGAAEAIQNLLVKVGDTELTKDTDYTVTYDGQKFVIDLIPAKNGNLTPNRTVTITFTTTIIDGAEIGEKTNEATLIYQSETGTETSQDASANATIYGIDVTKVNLTGKKLTGAEFALYDADPSTLSDEEKASHLVYIRAVTDADTGTVRFSGLNAGTYWLVETKAPDGYALLKTPVKIELKDTAHYTESVTILNTKTASLPITGGIGTLIFTFSGIALMGAAALLYIRSRKKKATEA